MHRLSSSEELVKFLATAALRLDSEGDSASSTRLKDGVACLNGLTDGWALLLESVEGVLKSPGRPLSVESEASLREAQAVLKSVVYR